MEYSYEINNKNPEEKKQFIQKLFDAIVPTYDLLNHLLSFGTDIYWRKNIFRFINNIRGKKAIDLCCGTGDLSLILHQKGACVFSLDFSLNMLKRGIAKQALKGFPVAADATSIPFKDDSFDLATIAFGIRNIPDLDHFFLEVHRILSTGGKLAILELVRPEKRLIRILYSFYLGKLIPLIGGIISGKLSAYQYLSDTISTFIKPKDIQNLMEKYGYENIEHHPRILGVATIIICQKGLS